MAVFLIWDLNLDKHSELKDALESAPGHHNAPLKPDGFCQALADAIVALVHTSDDEGDAMAQKVIAAGKPLVVYSWGGGAADRAGALGHPERVRGYGWDELPARVRDALSQPDDPAHVVEAMLGGSRLDLVFETLSTLWTLGLSWEVGMEPPCLRDGTITTCPGFEGTVSRDLQRLCWNEPYPRNPWTDHNGAELRLSDVYGNIFSSETPEAYQQRLAELRDVLMDCM